MESNDNGDLPRSADPETSFPPRGPIWQKPRQEIQMTVMTSQKNRVLWLTTVPESERKKAESKTSASRERTLSA